MSIVFQPAEGSHPKKSGAQVGGWVKFIWTLSEGKCLSSPGGFTYFFLEIRMKSLFLVQPELAAVRSKEEQENVSLHFCFLER